MSSDITQSGTPAGEPTVTATGETGTGSIAVLEDGVPVSVAPAETAANTAPPSMFRPTLRDVNASASEVGTPVAPRPLMPAPSLDGETAPCTGSDGAADQALILGPPGEGEIGGAAGSLAEAEGGAPAVASLSDGTNLFGDRVAMWSGNPSEVDAGYGLDPADAEVGLCDTVTFSVDEAV